MRSCRRVARPSRLHCPLVGPTKARARTPLTSTSALRRRCRSAGLIPSLRNCWSTWQKVEGQTCAPSAPTCSVSQGRDSPTTLRGRRPPCEHRLWNYVCVCERKHKVHPRMCDPRRIYSANSHTSTSMLSSPCAFSGLHLSEQPFRYYSPDASSSYIGTIFLFQCSPLS